MRKKRRVRSFFWKPIPEEKVRGQPNIWTMAVRCQQQYQIDVRSVEELFGQQEEVQGRGCVPATSGSSSARITRSRSFKENKDKVSLTGWIVNGGWEYALTCFCFTGGITRHKSAGRSTSLEKDVSSIMCLTKSFGFALT